MSGSRLFGVVTQLRPHFQLAHLRKQTTSIFDSSRAGSLTHGISQARQVVQCPRMAHLFECDSLKIICMSDTHNDDCTPQIPVGDIFIHAGDMTDDGTYEELSQAFNWISKLPHKLKVVVAGKWSSLEPNIHICRDHRCAVFDISEGNHDLGLDKSHANLSQAALDLFTSDKAQAAGIHLIDREIKIVAEYRTSSANETRPIRVYGNPMQPDFLNSSYAFTYKPYPNPSAVEAWITAPSVSGAFDIWAMHSPPRHRLDAINVPGLTGCVEQARAVAKARPLLCVFGHYHYSWGLEKVQWQSTSDDVASARILSEVGRESIFDFTETGPYGGVTRGQETIFVNAAWMTMKKSAVLQRNMPFVVILPLDK